MKLVDLIKYLKNQDELERLIKANGLNEESEAILICMENHLDIDSEIRFFEIEETEGDIIFEKNNIQYVTLFSVYHAMDLIKSDLELLGKEYSDLEIAKRLVEYGINDA